MRNRAEDITRYVFKPTDALLLDANIWFFVYGPRSPGNRKTAVYSGALARILASKSRIYMDVLILSEFINRYARLKYHIQYPDAKKRPDFKQFRKGAAFKPIAQGIADDVRRILRHCTRIESGFDALYMDALIDEYGKGNSDFNDQVLTGLCKSKGVKLITDDSDFMDRDLTVITASRHLLNRIVPA